MTSRSNKETVLQQSVGFEPHYREVSKDLLAEGSFGITRIVEMASKRGGFGTRVVEKRRLLPNDHPLIFENWKKLITCFYNIQKLEDEAKQRVVRYDKITISNGALCIFMEYCSYGNLETKVKHQDGPFSEEVVRCYAYQMTAGLDFLHKNGVVHGYLHPHNVLFVHKDALKIADYLTYQVTKQLGLSHPSGYAKDAECFVAPERRSGAPASQQDDVWSLGQIIHYLATRRKPRDLYLSGDLFDWLRRVLEGVRHREPASRQDCGWILRHLMAVDIPDSSYGQHGSHGSHGSHGICVCPVCGSGHVRQSSDKTHLAVFVLRTNSDGRDCRVHTFYLTATNYWTEAVNTMQDDERKSLVAHWSSCVIPLRGREVLLVDSSNGRAYYTENVLRGRWTSIHGPQRTRWNAVGVVRDNGVMLIGGSGSQHFNDAISSVEWLSLGGSLRDNRWSPMNSLPQPVVMPSAFVSPLTNEVIVAGGWRGTDAVNCLQTMNSRGEWRVHPDVFYRGDSVLSGCVNDKTRQMLICFKERIVQLEYEPESRRRPYSTKALCDKTLVSSHSMCIWRKHIVVGMADTVFFLNPRSGDVEERETLPVGDGHKKAFVMSFD